MNYKYLIGGNSWGFPKYAEFVTDMSFVETLEIMPTLLL